MLDVSPSLHLSTHTPPHTHPDPSPHPSSPHSHAHIHALFLLDQGTSSPLLASHCRPRPSVAPSPRFTAVARAALKMRLTCAVRVKKRLRERMGSGRHDRASGQAPRGRDGGASAES
eukprot:1037830-Rhodomonas_salina.2